MEYIFVDDVREHIQTLQKYVRPVGSTEHPMLFEGSVRDVDFVLSNDKQWVEPSLAHGLSFATSMKKFKSVFKLKARRFEEVDVYALDDQSPLPADMKIVRDRPGHASLVVTKRMTVKQLIDKLETLAGISEHIGSIKVSLL